MFLSDIGIMTAFLAGIVSFLSPCVLPLVPGYVSYVAGRALPEVEEAGAAERLSAFTLGLCFVAGFTTVFLLLGASATLLGQVFAAYRYELGIAGGVIVIVFGLFVIGLPRPAWLHRELRFHLEVPGGRPIAAYVLGLAFAFGWSPCIGPVLGAILTVSTVSPAISQGVGLLAVYSLGLGVPFLLAALFTGSLVRRLRGVARLGRVMQPLAGLVMVVMGVAMVTGDLTVFAYWLLDTFPVLGRIG